MMEIRYSDLWKGTAFRGWSKEKKKKKKVDVKIL